MDCSQFSLSSRFAIGYWQNGIAFMVLALLASPIGLPAVANFLPEQNGSHPWVL
ncbi:MAG: CD1845 family protein [Lachnospiraceae bacterium]